MQEIKWDIRHEGRSWSGQEAQQRYELIPEKIEMLVFDFTDKIDALRGRNTYFCESFPL